MQATAVAAAASSALYLAAAVTAGAGPVEVNRDEVMTRTFRAEVNGGLIAAGCGLRGAGPPVATGTIDLAGLPADAQVLTAILNWSVLADSPPSEDIDFHPELTAPQTWTGTPLGVDAPPCWMQTGIYGFRADVTAVVAATGNGRYTVTLPDSGDLDVEPSPEGAALLVAYCSPSAPPVDIVVYEGLETQRNGDTIQTVDGFDAAALLTRAAATFVVADGQGERLFRARGGTAGVAGTDRDAALPPTSGLIDGATVIAPFDGDEGTCAAPDMLYLDVDTVAVAEHVPDAATSAVATVDVSGDCTTWTGFALVVGTDTVDNPAYGCPVVPCPGVTADPGPPAAVCLGETWTLDGSGSSPCSGAGVDYRWLVGGAEACPWSPLPTCEVAPAAPADYVLEVRCRDRPGCYAAAAVTIDVDPGAVPPDLGNTLRGVKAATDVVLTWPAAPAASSYGLFRSDDRTTWPATRYRMRLPAATATEPDVPLPTSYYYRVVGENCAGVPGP